MEKLTPYIDLLGNYLARMILGTEDTLVNKTNSCSGDILVGRQISRGDMLESTKC